ncbi:M13 family metallopeptidase [Pseudonocardia spinosispora]|uniref:M13 family metallopeptidase n=1 Tax=Pseudonocardia spinosispora TaxID=103441 RepID=UPI000428EBAC|nr:M13-type metalloendopeptidase [Pseudonocardia spinosispora]
MFRHFRRLSVLGTTGLVLFTAACASGPAPVGSGLDLPGFDRDTRAQDSLYEFANGTWLKNTKIPPDLSEIGSFTKLSIEAEDNQKKIISDAAAKKDEPANSDERKIGDLYASFMDTDRLNQLRATPLDPYFAKVDALNTPGDLIRHLGEIQRFGASNPIGLSVNQDAKNATAYITEISQGGTSLPNRDYYLSSDPKYVDIRAKYLGYIGQLFRLSNLPDPDGTAKRILDLETQLAQAQWTPVQNRDTLAQYNKFTLSAANQATPGIDWDTYLTAAGITNQPNLIIDQPSFFKALGGLLATVPMDTWKQYLKWHLIQDNAPYLSSDFVDSRFDFVGKVLSGKQQNRDRWRRGIAAVNGAMGDALGHLYADRFFTPAAKQRAQDLVHNLLGAYKDSIGKLDWMTGATKQQAEDKLAKLAVKIGYPDKWEDFSHLDIKPDDLVGNMDRAAQREHQRAIDKLGKPVDRTEWFMNPQTVNAYYNPAMNEIVFPAAILQPPFFDPRADDAVNYGAIGAVIGHEISHAFDDQGRLYDGDGNLRDWWTPADAAAFSAKTAALVAQYNNYTPLPGAHVNGQLTLGENIADLSGLTIAYRAYRASLGLNQPAVLDGFTGDQRFFLGFATIWRTKERDESLHAGLLTDPHSPGEFRCNGVVPNVDAFYEAFGVKPGDQLYVAPAQRIHIW